MQRFKQTETFKDIEIKINSLLFIIFEMLFILKMNVYFQQVYIYDKLF